MQKLGVAIAWHAAYFQRVKRMPPLESVLSRIGEKRYVKTALPPKAVIAMMKARFGEKT